MPTIKIGRRAIAAIGVVAKSVTFWDEDLPGFGLIVRPSGSRSWLVSYRVGAGGRTGVQRRLTLGSGDTLSPEQARSAARDLLARVRLGADPLGERHAERRAESVRDLAERWFTEHTLPKRKPRTAERYRELLDLHILPRIGDRAASKVSRAEIEKLHRDVSAKQLVRRKLTDTKHSSKVRTIGGRVTANRSLAATTAIYNWGIANGALPEEMVNPCTGLEKFKESARERFLSVDEMVRLGAALTEAETIGLPWKVDQSKLTKHVPKERRTIIHSAHTVAAIRLLMLTGCRLGEVLNLEWTHVDLERGVLRLPDSKTGAKLIVLSAAAIKVIAVLPRLGRYVIAGETAGRPDEKPRRDMNRLWRGVTARAGLAGLRQHDLRHTFASAGVAQGLGLPIVGKLLGHASTATTARYAHLHVEPVRRAADLIAGEIAVALGLASSDLLPLD